MLRPWAPVSRARSTARFWQASAAHPPWPRIDRVFTNTVPTNQSRRGRPEACSVLERLANEAARLLGMDRAEIRRRNLIPLEAMPTRRLSGRPTTVATSPRYFRDCSKSPTTRASSNDSPWLHARAGPAASASLATSNHLASHRRGWRRRSAPVSLSSRRHKSVCSRMGGASAARNT